MTNRVKLLSAALAATTVFAVAGAAPSFALTAQECSAKYNAAKTGGTLNGMKWNDFRKAQCADDAAAAPAKAAEPAKPAAEAAKPAAKPAAAAAAAAGSAVFPKAVDAQYAKESAGKARMHTCRDQYKANKASNANGGLKWIMKGGGYYSQCNKALKS
jgi:hypothetical protein